MEEFRNGRELHGSVLSQGAIWTQFMSNFLIFIKKCVLDEVLDLGPGCKSLNIWLGWIRSLDPLSRCLASP